MKKTILSLLFILSFAAYVIHQRIDEGNSTTVPLATVQQASSNSGRQANPIPPTNAQTMPASAAGRYKDGTYTGSAADAFYGNVQVQTTVKSGKIVDVNFLSYPNDRGNSIRINNVAMPLLKQEAIQNQNANVDVVSGATATSQAFVQSLSSALSQASI
jgi:uncharacterized protein with FMN-binding domain